MVICEMFTGNKKMKYISTLLLFFLVPAVSYGVSGGVSGAISKINIKETGYMLITLESAHANPTGCLQSSMVAIPHTHLAKNEILSVLLSAHATRKPVSLWVTGCYENYGTSFPIGGTVTIYQE